MIDFSDRTRTGISILTLASDILCKGVTNLLIVDWLKNDDLHLLTQLMNRQGIFL